MNGEKQKRGIPAFAFLVLLMFFASARATLAAGEASAPSGQSKPAQAQAINPVTEVAVKAGMLACAERIEQVTNFLAGGAESGVYLFLPPSEPDKRLFSASLEVHAGGKNASPAYASMSFAPNQANGCGALYETVTYWDMSPGKLIKTRFPDFRRVGVMRRDITVLERGTVRIFVLPAGAGSISIKKEVLQ
ncbi:MAG: hypothetical protein M0Z59_05725 [Nitrospiraceae bacterium]|nr:hypothetical protein [Nitrospiraceae bacterium]